MATLTDVSGVSRNIIKGGIVLIIAITLMPVVIRIGKSIYLSLNPPPPPTPTVRYGKLPKLVFPANQDEATPEYTLETIEGSLPKLDTVGKVYVVGINKSRLLSLDRITQRAKSLGFTKDPVQLNEQNYLFNSDQKPMDLRVNVVSDGFAYRYDWTSRPEIFTTYVAQAANNAVSDAKQFLGQLVALPDDLVGGTNRTTFLSASGSAMVPADSAYGANFVRVDLFRADKDKLKVVSTGGDTSPVSVIVSGLSGDGHLVQANYKYSRVLDNDSSTYPLKGVNQAWKELNEGKAYIAKRTVPRVTIRRATLAYYESDEPQEYLQPVYVFEGDNGFMAYVWAISPEYQQ